MTMTMGLAYIGLLHMFIDNRRPDQFQAQAFHIQTCQYWRSGT